MASSSDQTHRFQNGRRYHTFDEGIYYLPNDEEEAMRLGEREVAVSSYFCLSDLMQKTCSI